MTKHLCLHVYVECLMLGTEVDLQQVENCVFAMEMVLKAWLQEQGGDREHLHLLLPSPTDSPIPGQILHLNTHTLVCIKFIAY